MLARTSLTPCFPECYGGAGDTECIGNLLLCKAGSFAKNFDSLTKFNTRRDNIVPLSHLNSSILPRRGRMLLPEKFAPYLKMHRVRAALPQIISMRKAGNQ
jgi:hypothetical protein